MFSKRDLIVVILTITTITVCWSIGHSLKKSKETITAIETTTATEKVSEIVTETPTTERKTERPIIEKKTTEVTTEESTGSVDINGYGWVQLQYFDTYHIMENHLTRSNGSIRVFGHRETWYSTNEAAGKATAREIPDKHIAEDGTIRDADGFICVASSDLPFYSIVMTSIGPGKVYDCGCSSGTIDVYTTW